MPEVALRYPLRLDSRGVAVQTRSSQSIWGDRVRLLLTTMSGERVHDSEYGTTAQAALFDGIDEIEEVVAAAVEGALNAYMPEITRIEVTVTEKSDDRAAFLVTYVAPDGGEYYLESTLDIANLTVN